MQANHRPNWFAAGWPGQFLASPGGRWTRFLAGIVLIAVGFGSIGGTLGLVVAAVGLVPFLAGAFDVCVFSALFGGPFRGAAIRSLARH
jgi:hypothetical protein